MLWGEVRLDCFGGLIAHDVYFWFEPFVYKIFKFFVYASNMHSESSPAISVIRMAFVS